MTNGRRPSPSLNIDNRLAQKHNSPPSAASPSDHVSVAPQCLLEVEATNASLPVPGFLGPTSYSAVFTEGQSHIKIDDHRLCREISERDWQPSRMPSWSSSKVKEGAEILSLLADLPKYEPVLNQWFKVQCMTATVVYLRECIALIPPDLKESHSSSNFLATLSHKVFLRTNTPRSLDANISLREHASFLMGEDICWELVVLMLTAMGMSAISMDEVNLYDDSDSQIDWKDLAHQLLRAGDQCIDFCEQVGHLNNTGVTLILMNFILHTQVYGDAGECARGKAMPRDYSHTP